MRGMSPASSGHTGTRLDSRLRELADRVRRVEARRPNIIGDWRLFTDKDTGYLMAEHIPSGVIRTLAYPRSEDG